MNTHKCARQREFVEDNNHRVQENPAHYRKRQQIIEHQFGTLKRHWHFDYVLTKGKEKVMGEVYLAFTTYNLRRLMNIFDFDTLMRKVKAHFKAVFLYYKSLFKPIRTYLKDFKNKNPDKANIIENNYLFKN